MPRASNDLVLRQELDALIGAICKALNDPTRVALLYALQARPHIVSELCDVIDAPRPNISQHLAVLRDAGLVAAQQQGRTVVYSLRHIKVIDAIDLLRQVMHDEIARKQALRACPPSRSRRRDVATDRAKAVDGSVPIAHVTGSLPQSRRAQVTTARSASRTSPTEG
jgi:ArsR family transcriptional regulator